ncbi:hypothetical protein ACFQ0R_12120 [Psychroflexus salinarum]|uniref:Sulfotransferase family protein n=1 Tax=Psychroflexus salinarum TaxID=546024 RepID=A0ABW3GS15_9FLAO
MQNQKKNLLIHLGPPKTGTTSLQHWLLSNEDRGFSYIGIKPKRYDEKKNKHANVFLKYIYGNKNKNDFVSYLNNLSHYKNLMYSEELILYGENWICNLKKLACLQDSFNIHLAYCYRNSIKAIPSAYAEYHSNLNPKLKKSFELFLHSEFVKPYKLDEVINVFNELNLKFHIFDFEKLVKEKLCIDDLFGINSEIPFFKRRIRLSTENKTKKSELNSYTAKVQTPEQLKLELKIRKLSNKYFKKDFSNYFKRSYKIKINKTDELLKIANNNEKTWSNID